MQKVRAFDSTWDALAGATVDRTILNYDQRQQGFLSDDVMKLMPRSYSITLFSVKEQGFIYVRKVYSTFDFMKDFGGTLFFIEIFIGFMCQHVSDFTV